MPKIFGASRHYWSKLDIIAVPEKSGKKTFFGTGGGKKTKSVARILTVVKNTEKQGRNGLP